MNNKEVHKILLRHSSNRYCLSGQKTVFLRDASNQRKISQILRASSHLMNIPLHKCDIKKGDWTSTSIRATDIRLDMQPNANIVAISCLVDRACGERIDHEVNKLLGLNNELQLEFSNWWLARFQKRFDLKFCKVLEKSGEKHISSTCRSLSQLKKIIAHNTMTKIYETPTHSVYSIDRFQVEIYPKNR